MFQLILNNAPNVSHEYVKHVQLTVQLELEYHMCKANLDNNIHFVVEYKNSKKNTKNNTKQLQQQQKKHARRHS